jgi:hypothetical protein
MHMRYIYIHRPPPTLSDIPDTQLDIERMPNHLDNYTVESVSPDVHPRNIHRHDYILWI